MLTEEKTSRSESGTDSAPVRRICFVCTGNTCRSPMAAAVANAYALEKAETAGNIFPELVAESRGICAYEGDCISPGAERALISAEIPRIPAMDYHKHRARRLSDEDIARFDLFVCLTEGHVVNMMMRFPEATSKIIRMPRSITDPFDEDDAVYRRSLDEIIKGVIELFFPEKIQHEG